MGLSDADVLHWASLVPSPYGAGLLADVAALELPPRYRVLMATAKAWLARWKEATTDGR
jgi:hypothetical protein